MIYKVLYNNTQGIMQQYTKYRATIYKVSRGLLYNYLPFQPRVKPPPFSKGEA